MGMSRRVGFFLRLRLRIEAADIILGYEYIRREFMKQNARDEGGCLYLGLLLVGLEM